MAATAESYGVPIITHSYVEGCIRAGSLIEYHPSLLHLPDRHELESISGPAPLLDLPSEILVHIFAKFQQSDKAIFSSIVTCKRLHDVSICDALWQARCKRDLDVVSLATDCSTWMAMYRWHATLMEGMTFKAKWSVYNHAVSASGSATISFGPAATVQVAVESSSDSWGRCEQYNNDDDDDEDSIDTHTGNYHHSEYCYRQQYTLSGTFQFQRSLLRVVTEEQTFLFDVFRSGDRNSTSRKRGLSLRRYSSDTIKDFETKCFWQTKKVETS